MTLIVLTLLVCHPWEWLTWTLPLCRMFLASGPLTPRVRSLGCYQDSFGMSFACKEYVAIALDRHMINTHLELGQLWRCPVKWCAVWKGSVWDCLDHLREKHGGVTVCRFKESRKVFPSMDCPPWLLPWALQPDVSGVAVDIKLFHDAQVSDTPWSHPSSGVEGGGCQKADWFRLPDYGGGVSPGGVLPGCSASPSAGVVPLGFVCPGGCSDWICTVVFDWPGNGFSHWPSSWRPGANGPVPHAVSPAGLCAVSRGGPHGWIEGCANIGFSVSSYSTRFSSDYMAGRHSGAGSFTFAVRLFAGTSQIVPHWCPGLADFVITD